MVACGRKRLIQQGLKLHKPFCDLMGIESSLHLPNGNGNMSFNSASTRHMCQLVSKMSGNRAFLVDTLALSAMMQESALSKFKAEVHSSQEHHFSLLQHETEKLRTAIDKMQSELRYEIDKVAAGQRLDLNLERGRIREELADQNAETSSLTNKLDREIHTLKTQMEAGKYDVIKYCIGTIVSVTAVGLGLLRVFL